MAGRKRTQPDDYSKEANQEIGGVQQDLNSSPREGTEWIVASKILSTNPPSHGGSEVVENNIFLPNLTVGSQLQGVPSAILLADPIPMETCRLDEGEQSIGEGTTIIGNHIATSRQGINDSNEFEQEEGAPGEEPVQIGLSSPRSQHVQAILDMVDEVVEGQAMPPDINLGARYTSGSPLHAERSNRHAKSLLPMIKVCLDLEGVVNQEIL